MTTTNAVNEAVARPVRTVVQMAPSGVITEFIDAFVHNLDDRQYAALFALLTLLIGFAQTALENRTGKAFLRTVPPRAVPVVDNNAG
jgi:hypothetical protein